MKFTTLATVAFIAVATATRNPLHGRGADMEATAEQQLTLEQEETFCKRFTAATCCKGHQIKRDTESPQTFGSCEKCRGRSYTCPRKTRPHCGWWGCGPPPPCVRFGNCGRRGNDHRTHPDLHPDSHGHGGHWSDHSQ